MKRKLFSLIKCSKNMLIKMLFLLSKRFKKTSQKNKRNEWADGRACFATQLRFAPYHAPHNTNSFLHINTVTMQKRRVGTGCKKQSF